MTNINHQLCCNSIFNNNYQNMNIDKLICIYNFFPKVDFCGFWICYKGQNSETNDTKYVHILISSRYKLLLTTLQVLGKQKEEDCTTCLPVGLYHVLHK